MYNATFLKLGICLSLLSLLTYSQESSSQRMILYLKKPVEDESVNIKVNQNIETNAKIEKKGIVKEIETENLNSLSYLPGPDGKFLLTLNLVQSGYIRLEAYHFNGQKVGVLFNNVLAEGTHVFEEQESWKSFMNIKGVAFLTLFVNDRKVLKKLISKME